MLDRGTLQWRLCLQLRWAVESDELILLVSRLVVGQDAPSSLLVLVFWVAAGTMLTLMTMRAGA